VSLHTARYYGQLVAALPQHCERALEIGCGTGEFARKLATAAQSVVAIDRDLTALSIATSETDGARNLTFVNADFLAYPFAASARFDFVCALASLHHMPLREALGAMKALLRPGGVLGVIGLHRFRGIVDFLQSAIARPISLLLKIRANPENECVRLAEPVHTLREISTIATAVLPGAVIRRHLLWRYTLLYQEPESDTRR
jgi:SAM-dependent methyltransferase